MFLPQRDGVDRSNPPYNKMLIPYLREDVDGLDEANVDPQLKKMIEKSKSENMNYAVIIAANYINKGRIREGKKYLDLYQWNFPANYRPYLIQARFGQALTKNFDDTFASYKTAYLLSGKMKSIYDEITGFLTQNSREDLSAEIEKYGEPVE